MGLNHWRESFPGYVYVVRFIDYVLPSKGTYLISLTSTIQQMIRCFVG